MRVDNSLHYPVVLDIGDSLVDFVQPVMAGDKFFPGEAIVVFGHDLNRAVKVAQIDSPGSFDGQMFFVDVEMRIHRNIAVVGILPDDHVGPGIPGQRHAFFDCGGEAGRFDDHIRAPPRGHCLDGGNSFFNGRGFDVDHGIYAKLPGKLQSVRRAADYYDFDSSGELRQNSRIQADRAAALDNDGIA